MSNTSQHDQHEPITRDVADDRRAITGSVSSSALLAAYQAALALASETRLDAVLQRLVELAREVASARYAALGVADHSGRLLQFIHSGLTEEEVAEIGPLPEGHGLLGVLIHEGKPLLILDITADPRSVGFPPHHPPMKTLLGVPILLDGQPIGNLYLSERTDGKPFSDDDLAAVTVLAAHAATAIQRARLIDELARARREAEAQRDHVQVIIDQLPVGVVIQLPPDRRIEQANLVARRMIAGRSALAGGSPLSAPYADGNVPTMHFLDANGAPLPVREWPGALALAGETTAQRQFLLVPESGDPIPVLVHASPLYGSDGEIARAVVAFQDVTRLREAEQLKDDFLSLVSHEFRTPLTAIHGGAQLLGSQGDQLDPETERDLLGDIVAESARLDQMLGNMLRLGEVMAGRLKPVMEPLLLGPSIRQISREVVKRTPDVRIEIELPPDLPAVEGDADLLLQVLRNLLENAIKYSPGEKRITITAGVVGEAVEVHIADQGVGIAPEHVPFVFERFRRPGADPTIRGMGLGLYLCRHLIAAQGGRIWVESAGVNRGATFSFALPIAAGWNDSW
ncbi:MAG: ATP-binding protein [Thermomicrobiales bacterium]